MKCIIHNENARDNLLHIETAGCIVNITVNLHNAEGKPTTVVEIIPDQYSNETWMMHFMSVPPLLRYPQ